MIDAPDGQSYVLRMYPSGTMARFPSAANAPLPGGLLGWPLTLLGWLLHAVAFRRRWTVAVTRLYNLPGHRHREGAESKTAAAARAAALGKAIQSGELTPGSGPPR